MAASKPSVGKQLGEIAASAKAMLQLIRKEGRDAQVSARIAPIAFAVTVVVLMIVAMVLRLRRYRD